ncbi:hypothetical protein H696_01407 [Fonticula alba]|uniref:Uncharacterized protein n=1 Tax=Fonticula alba TaxID=691883 RepID=A0A058ZC66_FONAL|nr:hypothetical protein H696_01407 [Fonticula alba]KCV72000.1 hypothetical protein H696_01407 [Fonticula alba]|eukprot:XP_009493578.1 hypothetical protein H696_01407 [Fonticula alba]
MARSWSLSPRRRFSSRAAALRRIGAGPGSVWGHGGGRCRRAWGPPPSPRAPCFSPAPISPSHAPVCVFLSLFSPPPVVLSFPRTPLPPSGEEEEEMVWGGGRRAAPCRGVVVMVCGAGVPLSLSCPVTTFPPPPRSLFPPLRRRSSF